MACQSSAKNGGLGGPSKLSKNGGSVACQSSARTADLHGGLSKLGKSGRLGSLSKLSKNGCSVACQSSARTRTWWPVKARQKTGRSWVACQSSARTADLVACQSSARTADLVTAQKQRVPLLRPPTGTIHKGHSIRRVPR